jgi:hypothetical protein
MYRLNVKYKFEMPNRIFYTGIVLEEDINHVKINSIRGEELILKKEEIVQAIKLEGDFNV